MTIYQTPPPDYAPEVALPPEGAYIRPSSPWYGRIPQYGSYIRHDSSPLVMLVIGFVLGALVFGNFINFPVFLDSFRSVLRQLRLLGQLIRVFFNQTITSG